MSEYTESLELESFVTSGRAILRSGSGDREEQQDSCMVRASEAATLAVVADGAGGHVGGAAASAKVVEILDAAWNACLEKGAEKETAAVVLKQALMEAHRAVIAAGGDAVHSGKSTVVLLYIAHGVYTVMHVGDSRLYARHGAEWECMTDDDSVLHLMVLSGRISPEDAKNHPDQSRLTQAIGAREEPDIHVEQGPYLPDTEYLLCCDGFWNQLPDEEWLQEQWPGSAKNPSALLEKKMGAAHRGGQGDSDNVTAIWLSKGAQAAPPCRSGRLLFLALLIVCFICFLLGGMVGFILRGMWEEGLLAPCAASPVEGPASAPAAE